MPELQLTEYGLDRPESGDDVVVPFTLEQLDSRGRVVRLGDALDQILTRHNYPAPVARLLGEAVVLAALIGSSLTDVQPHKAGAASGLLATGQQFATAAGVAVLSEIFFSGLGSTPGIHGYVRAIQHVLLLDVGLLVVCLGASLFMPRPRRAPAAAVVDAEVAAALE